MNKNILIGAGAAILIGVFMYFFLTNEKPKVFNWNESYNIESQQPYGTFIIHELMKRSYDGHYTQINSPLSSLLSTEYTNSVYILIGENAYYTDQDLDTLLDFTYNGNETFIATNYFPYRLINSLIDEECGRIEFIDSEQADMRLAENESEFSYKHIYNQEPYQYSWMYLDSLECAENLSVLGYIDSDKVNFVDIVYGEGHLYFYTTPLTFTNYYLTREELLAYTEEVMQVTHGENLYWDEYSKKAFTPDKSRNNPMKYILSQPPLRWAWYLLIFAVLIYFLFYAKRRQRIIPVLEKNRNTSIEFAETMGYLYYEEQNHKKIADHIWSLFLSYIRHRYYIHPQKMEPAIIKKVSLKSQVPETEVEAIVKIYEKLDFKVEISTEDLMSFHNKIESFYKKSK